MSELVCMKACEKAHGARRHAQQTRTCCSSIAVASLLINTGCRRSGHAHGQVLAFCWSLSADLYSVPHLSHECKVLQGLDR